MKPVIVHTLYFSPTGTSKRIATAVARGLCARNTGECRSETTDLTHAEAPAATYPADAAAIFAVPVYGGHVPPAALRRMESIRGNGTPAVVVAVYGNRDIGQAVAELADFISARGFVPVAAAAFVGEHSYSTPNTPIAAGRPDDNDLTEAAAFGRRVQEKLRGGTLRAVDAHALRAPRTPLLPLLRFIAFVLKNRRRQKKHPAVIVPVTDAGRCTACGRCALLCPTQAIATADPLHSDPERCIRCCACVKGCPTAARSFETPFAAVLSRNFSRPKRPVTLL